MHGFGYEKGAHNDFLLGKMKGVGYVLFAHNDLDDEKQGQSANEQVSQATQLASEPASPTTKPASTRPPASTTAARSSQSEAEAATQKTKKNKNGEILDFQNSKTFFFSIGPSALDPCLQPAIFAPFRRQIRTVTESNASSSAGVRGGAAHRSFPRLKA